MRHRINMSKTVKKETDTKTYAVGIPSRGGERIPYIQDIVCAFEKAVNKPQYIVIVDNNDTPLIHGKVKSDVFPLHVVQSEYGTNQPSGNQTALNRFIDDNIDIAFKWDDDLVPQDGCIDRLFALVSEGAPAAGGVYPAHFEQRLCYHVKDNVVFVPDYNLKHTQFFKWRDETILDTPFLYSSFAYDVKKAKEIGGFFVNYSSVAHREETDFTLRLSRGKNILKIDTQAVATHYLVSGGSREINDETRNMRIKTDNYIFNKRMNELGIKWE